MRFTTRTDIEAMMGTYNYLSSNAPRHKQKYNALINMAFLLGQSGEVDIKFTNDGVEFKEKPKIDEELFEDKEETVPAPKEEENRETKIKTIYDLLEDLRNAKDHTLTRDQLYAKGHKWNLFRKIRLLEAEGCQIKSWKSSELKYTKGKKMYTSVYQLVKDINLGEHNE